jgi:phosphopantothenoylcysteine decarboxylase/phosphopantothenate--cysteine ligase
MGYALAVEALARGAQVTIVSANVKLEAPAGAELIPVATAAELAAATYAGAEHADIVLMAAAVADFRPVAPVADKLKKSGEAALTRIELEPTEDVLSVLAAERRDRQLLIGFAAEHGERAAEYGREKLKRKQLDAIVVNDISRPEIGFDSEENEVLILTRDGGSRAVPRSSKAKVATTVLDEVQRLREVSAALLN